MGVVKDEPLCKEEPPRGRSNHWIVPKGAVAVRVAVPISQIGAGVETVGAGGVGLTVTKRMALQPVFIIANMVSTLGIRLGLLKIMGFEVLLAAPAKVNIPPAGL